MNTCTTCNKLIIDEETCFDCNKLFCSDFCIEYHIKTSSFHIEKSQKSMTKPINESNKIQSPYSQIGKYSLNPVKNLSYKDFSYIKIGNKNQLLGKGAYGDVFKAEHRVDNKKYAIKVVNKVRLLKNNVNPIVINKEIDIHMRIDHPYIINLRCYYQSNEEYFIVLDYAKNGSLYSKLKKIKSGFSEDSASKYFIQTAYALYFLHNNNLCHRDLKPENLLLDDNNNIKLCDFGWCDYIDSTTSFSTICGTLEYMAPEIFNKKYDFKVDCWAIGCLLYELLHGKSPFVCEDKVDDDEKKERMIKNIINCKYNVKEEISNEAKDLIKRLLEKDAKSRYTIEEVLNHDWVISKNTKWRSSKKLNTVYLKPHQLGFDDNLISKAEKEEQSDYGHKLFYSPIKRRRKDSLLYEFDLNKKKEKKDIEEYMNKEKNENVELEVGVNKDLLDNKPDIIDENNNFLRLYQVQIEETQEEIDNKGDENLKIENTGECLSNNISYIFDSTSTSNNNMRQVVSNKNSNNYLSTIVNQELFNSPSENKKFTYTFTKRNVFSSGISNNSNSNFDSNWKIVNHHISNKSANVIFNINDDESNDSDENKILNTSKSIRILISPKEKIRKIAKREELDNLKGILINHKDDSNKKQKNIEWK